MKQSVSIPFSLVAWFAVIVQLVLMILNRTTSIPESIVRFFSFYTIITNTLVAIYFTVQAFSKTRSSWWFKPGTLTAITVYITIVGLVYQIVLRPIWDPQGLQKVVDELLHSVIPVITIICWVAFENKSKVSWKSIPGWLVYPLVYLFFIMVRGSFSHFYPYPFVDVDALGFSTVMMNSTILTGVFIFFSAFFIGAGRLMTRKEKSA